MSRRFGAAAAATAGAVVVVLLSYSFAIAIALPGAQSAGPLATIATGIAMASVALFTYRLNLRSHDLEQRTFQAAHEPSLGISWKNRAMYPRTEARNREERHPFYEEFFIWNAGDVPILLEQPLRVVDRELGPEVRGGTWVEVEKLQGSNLVVQRAFPVFLGREETCLWRQSTVDDATEVSSPSAIVARTREEAVKFLLSQQGDKRFLYQVIYFSKPPAEISSVGDVHEQYVGFSYRVSLKKGDD